MTMEHGDLNLATAWPLTARGVLKLPLPGEPQLWAWEGTTHHIGGLWPCDEGIYRRRQDWGLEVLNGSTLLEMPSLPFAHKFVSL